MMPPLLKILLSLAMPLVTPPFSRVDHGSILKSPHSMSHSIRYLSLIIGSWSYQSAISPHIVVLPSPLVVGAIFTKHKYTSS
jgi:hypothetical protein